MDSANFGIKLTAMAERNYYNQIIWLEENRSTKLADEFEASF